VVGSSECSNEPMDFMKGVDFRDYLGDCQILKEDCE
jgi:hypothetical protein